MLCSVVITGVTWVYSSRLTVLMDFFPTKGFFLGVRTMTVIKFRLPFLEEPPLSSTFDKILFRTHLMFRILLMHRVVNIAVLVNWHN